jgi:glycosyltransferase involved in cell wall biosynthesis
MRVLHVYSGNLYGGIESILVAIARDRSDLQSEIAVCFDGRLIAELTRTGVRTHQLPPARASRPLTVRRSRQALLALLRAEHFDRVICHAAWAHAMFGAPVRRAGIPLVFWAHDLMTGRPWTERWARLTPPDLVIGNSDLTTAAVATVFSGVPAIRIYAPVEPAASLSPADRHKLRRDLDTPDEATVIVQASRSESGKGHALLAEALGRLREVPGWIWWQIGGAQWPGEEAWLQSVRQLAQRMGIADRVRFAGQRCDVPRLLAAADIHCQANTRPEAFGIAFVEALAAGLPVVTTAIGGAIEIVDDTCGMLVDANDPPALAGALRRLIVDRPFRASLAAVAPARARALCDPHTQVRRLADALARMPASSPRAAA